MQCIALAYAYVQTPGNGTNRLFSVPFPFILRAHVKVFVGYDVAASTGTELVDGTGFTWVSDTQIQTAVAPATGAVLTVIRRTPNGSQLVVWSAASPPTQTDLNTADLQSLYVIQEQADLTAAAVVAATAAAATANAAAAAVASALPYQPIESVAGIPTQPTIGQRIEIGNSTGIESFGPLTGRPAGFTGSPQSRVRLTYAAPNTWVWVDYAVADPDGRYALSAFTQSGAGAVARGLAGKVAEDVSVRDFGAVGNGIADDTAAFSAAAKASPALVNINGPGASLPRALMCKVLVPAGNYVLTSEVDTGNRDVTWVLDQAAIVSGYYFLNGQVLRAGRRQTGFHHGTTDYACGYSIKSNSDLAEGAAVLGIQAASDLATYPDRDSVALYVDNLAPAANVDVNTATYTSTTVTIAPQSVTTVRRYRRGMIIDTKHTPKWSGIVDSWNSNGSVITVTGWFRLGSAAGTPANGTGCALNGFTKIWAHNSNVFLTSGSYASQASGFELGTFNNKGPLDYANKTNYIWGYDSVNLGTYEGAAAFIARNNPGAKWFRGFECEDAAQVAFHVGGSPTNGFWSEQTSGTPFRFSRGGIDYFSVDFNGNLYIAGVLQSDALNGALALGKRTAASTPFVNFYSGGLGADYDARIIANGGNANPGNGGLTFIAGAGNKYVGDIYPDTTNLFTLGRPTGRWSFLYAGVGDFSGDVKSAGSLQSNVINGAVTLGLRTTSSTPFVNFYSSGSNSDFDARLIASGGSSTAGSGTLTVVSSGGLRIAGSTFPDSDNLFTNGTASRRWSVVYANSGSINTSDSRSKEDVSMASDAEQRVASKLGGLIRKFRFSEAIAVKGERARIHFGVIAQEVIKVFSDEGLDAYSYGIVCYDSWGDQPEVQDGGGRIVSAFQPAGDRYGIRYDELLIFMFSALHGQVQALQQAADRVCDHEGDGIS